MAIGETVTYTNDKVGRLTQVAGAWSGVSQTYPNNPHYRAWGALQNLDYGNGTEMNVLGFNNRLQATEFEVKKDTTSIISKEYEFYADGQMKLSTDYNTAKFVLLINGRGQVNKSTYQAGTSNHNATSIRYDVMGRQWKVSRPYDTGSSPSDWSEIAHNYTGCVPLRFG